MTDRERDSLIADLSAYLDGELPAARLAEVERFLAADAEARAVLESLRGAVASVGALPRRAAPQDLAGFVMRNAERRALLGDVEKRPRGRIYHLLAQVSASAAVILLCAVIAYQVVQAPDQSTPVPDRGLPRSLGEPDRAAPKSERRIEESDHSLIAAAEPVPVPAAPGAAENAGQPVIVLKDVPAPAPPMADALAVEVVPEREVNAGWPVDAGPHVNVAVTPQDMVSYQATVALLEDWAGRGLAAEVVTAGGAGAGRLGMPGKRGREAERKLTAEPVERVYEIPAGELSYRLGQLDLQAPEQVQVQMYFVASAEGDLLEEAARGREQVVWASLREAEAGGDAEEPAGQELTADELAGEETKEFAGGEQMAGGRFGGAGMGRGGGGARAGRGGVAAVPLQTRPARPETDVELLRRAMRELRTRWTAWRAQERGERGGGKAGRAAGSRSAASRDARALALGVPAEPPAEQELLNIVVEGARLSPLPATASQPAGEPVNVRVRVYRPGQGEAPASRPAGR